MVVRVRGDRTFYRQPVENDGPKRKGHPRWFGTKFDLGDSETYKTPDETVSVTFTTRRGRECIVSIMAWRDLLMRGKKNIPMHKHPFTVLRITVEDKDGNPVYRKPMQLIIFGDRRDEITVEDAYNAYRQRFDMEHFFRFGKTKLLMDSYQTSETEHEENWWIIAGLAYAQLFAASGIAEKSSHPWERYLPYFKRETGISTPSTVLKDMPAFKRDNAVPMPSKVQEEMPDFKRDIGISTPSAMPKVIPEFKRNTGVPTPSTVQRDMPRIILEFGTPAKAPKPRGKSPGRLKGECPGKRERFPVIKKSDLRQKKTAQGP